MTERGPTADNKSVSKNNVKGLRKAQALKANLARRKQQQQQRTHQPQSNDSQKTEN